MARVEYELDGNYIPALDIKELYNKKKSGVSIVDIESGAFDGYMRNVVENTLFEIFSYTDYDIEVDVDEIAFEGSMKDSPIVIFRLNISLQSIFDIHKDIMMLYKGGFFDYVEKHHRGNVLFTSDPKEFFQYYEGRDSESAMAQFITFLCDYVADQAGTSVEKILEKNYSDDDYEEYVVGYFVEESVC